MSELVKELAHADRGLIMVMGKGGVGKTTIASAIALGWFAAGSRGI
jgi:arsenite-transporting ATPase